MKARRRFRQEVEAANFKRQTQALTILTIGTVIFGGALFQLDFSLNIPFSDWPNAARFQVSAVFLMAVAYIGLISDVARMLAHDTPIKGSDLAQNVMFALAVEAACAAAIFGFGLFAKPT